MTTYDQRQEKSRLLCEKLIKRIGEAATAVPVGHWPPIADAPSAEFMEALTAWEVDPSDVTMARVTDTYGRVIDAWRIAGAEFTAERSEA